MFIVLLLFFYFVSASPLFGFGDRPPPYPRPSFQKPSIRPEPPLSPSKTQQSSDNFWRFPNPIVPTTFPTQTTTPPSTADSPSTLDSPSTSDSPPAADSSPTADLPPTAADTRPLPNRHPDFLWAIPPPAFLVNSKYIRGPIPGVDVAEGDIISVPISDLPNAPPAHPDQPVWRLIVTSVETRDTKFTTDATAMSDLDHPISYTCMLFKAVEDPTFLDFPLPLRQTPKGWVRDTHLFPTSKTANHMIFPGRTVHVFIGRTWVIEHGATLLYGRASRAAIPELVNKIHQSPPPFHYAIKYPPPYIKFVSTSALPVSR